MFTGFVRMGPLSDRVDAIIGCQTSCCSAVKVSSQTVDKALNFTLGKRVVDSAMANHFCAESILQRIPRLFWLSRSYVQNKACVCIIR